MLLENQNARRFSSLPVRMMQNYNNRRQANNDSTQQQFPAIRCRSNTGARCEFVRVVEDLVFRPSGHAILPMFRLFDRCREFAICQCCFLALEVQGLKSAARPRVARGCLRGKGELYRMVNTHYRQSWQSIGSVPGELLHIPSPMCYHNSGTGG